MNCVYVCLSVGWSRAVLKRLNRSRCRLDCGLAGPTNVAEPICNYSKLVFRHLITGPMNHVLGGARISSSTRKGTLRLSMHANGRYSRRYAQEGMELRKMRTRRSNAQFTPSDPTQENFWEAWQFCRVGSGGVNNWKSEITDAGFNIDCDRSSRNLRPPPLPSHPPYLTHPRRSVVDVSGRHGTGSLGHRVNGSFGSSFTSGSPGHHFDPV